MGKLTDYGDVASVRQKSVSAELETLLTQGTR